jgi:hypothetical protein
MMSFPNRRKNIEREERRELRYQREDAAGKLLKKVPDLTSLNLAIHEKRPSGCINETHYIRRVVVEHAAALLEVPCSHPDCNDGGYDITREVLFALAAHQARFEGEHTCRGTTGMCDCGRLLKFVGTATYRASVSALSA